MKISSRLITGFGALIIMFGVCAAIAIYSLYNTLNALDMTVDVTMKKSNLVNEIQTVQRDMAITVRNISLFVDPKGIQEQDIRLKKLHDNFIQKSKELSTLISVDEGSDEYKAYKIIQSNEENALSSFSNAAKIATSESRDATIKYLLEQVRPAQNPLLDGIEKMNISVTKKSEDTVKKNRSLVARLTMAFVLISISSVIFGGGVCFYTIKKLNQQLGGEPDIAQNLASSIASGNLTTTVNLRNNDKTSLLSSLHIMQENLRYLLRQIKDSAESVAISSDEIANGNNELSTRTEQQAAALQETAASMEQITTTIKNNTETAQNMAQSARETANQAKLREVDVRNMSETMSGISDSATKIQDIINVIEGISFQTNILALNAAVEAARAGEAGRGFAVVAAEVRNLAVRSATAAKEIKELIEKTATQIEKGVVVATTTGRRILDIVDMVDELAHVMDSLSVASSEQMMGISQISIAVHQMDGVTQSNAALVEESSSASDALSEQARKLREMVDSFNVGTSKITNTNDQNYLSSGVE